MHKVNPEILEYIRDRIIPQYEGFDSAHRVDHVESVIAAALEMSRHYDVDVDIVAMADLSRLFVKEYICESNMCPTCIWSFRIIRDG